MSLSEFTWIVHGVGLIFLLWLIKKVFGYDAVGLLKLLLQEMRDLLRKDLTMGAYNMMGAIFIFVFGAFTIAALKLEAVFQKLSLVIGIDKAKELHGYVSPAAMFFTLTGFLIFSLVVVAWDKTNGRK